MSEPEARLAQAIQVLTGETPVIYKDGCTIQWGEFYELSKYRQDILMKIFASGSEYPVSFLVYFPCEDCEVIAPFEFSKSKLQKAFSVIRSREGRGKRYQGEPFICAECSVKRSQSKKALSKQWDEERKAEEARKREVLYGQIINPERRWGTDPKFWFQTVLGMIPFDGEHELASRIKLIPYRDFLRTPYWAAVAGRVKYKAKFRCQMCNAQGQIHVHHRSYDCHGYEHVSLSDLICVCAACHKKHHFGGPME